MSELCRCPWADSHPLMLTYHDTEWGVPVHDDRALFAKLLLDSAQAGLSWLTVLKKRDAYYAAFDDFDPEKMARYDEARIATLLANPGIIRNRQKIEAAVHNARRFLELREQPGGFDTYLWQFVDGQMIRNAWTRMDELPATSPESEAMSKDLKQRGFKFVGPTICYAFMQAVGMVNDHLVTCFRYDAL
jgi:DNA-3-methyladenine glycosylase I